MTDRSAVVIYAKRTTGATDGPKSPKAFRWQCRQLTARRLAGCGRVDARFTLAFWTLAPGRWRLDPGPVGRGLPSALVAFGTRRCRLGMVRKTRSINRRPSNNRSDGRSRLLSRVPLWNLGHQDCQNTARKGRCASPVLRII